MRCEPRPVLDLLHRGRQRFDGGRADHRARRTCVACAAPGSRRRLDRQSARPARWLVRDDQRRSVRLRPLDEASPNGRETMAKGGRNYAYRRQKPTGSRRGALLAQGKEAGAAARPAPAPPERSISGLRLCVCGSRVIFRSRCALPETVPGDRAGQHRTRSADADPEHGSAARRIDMHQQPNFGRPLAGCARPVFETVLCGFCAHVHAGELNCRQVIPTDPRMRPAIAASQTAFGAEGLRC